MSQPLKVLLVEDDANDAIFICHELKKGGFTVASERVHTVAAMRKAIEERSWDVVIADYSIMSAGFNGLEALKIARETGLDIPVLIVSGRVGEETAVEVMRAGAQDYLLKDRLFRLVPAVRRELQETEVRRARRFAEEKLKSEYAFREAIEKTTPTGVVVIDLEGQITYVNPAFCSLVGWNAANLLGRKPPYIFWPDEKKNVYIEEFWKKLRSGKEPASSEVTLCHQSGKRVDVLIHTTILKDQSDAQIGWLSSFTDITRLKRTEEALRDLNEQLEQRVLERTSELQQAIEARKRLENELLDIVEKERQRLGLELHDDLGQRLSGMVLMAKGLELKLQKQSRPEAKEASRIHANIEEAINLTKGLTKNLVSWDFRDGSLAEALRRLADQKKKMFAISCRFLAQGTIPNLPPEVKMHLYKIAQEAVSNGIKHGKAAKVQIRLMRTRGQLVLTVKNDGLPFPAVEQRKAGSGIQIMNYRAHVIGASFDIRSRPGTGTEVICILPLKPGP